MFSQKFGFDPLKRISNSSDRSRCGDQDSPYSTTGQHDLTGPDFDRWRGAGTPNPPSVSLDHPSDLSPKTTPDTPSFAETVSDIPILGSLRVLIVDDQASNHEILEGILEQRGHEYVSAYNGCEAITRFTEAEFDVILMDLEMPCKNGFQATREIRRLEGGHDIPIIALSSCELADLSERCLAEGMTDLLTKPYVVHDLLVTIERAVAKVRLDRLTELLEKFPDLKGMYQAGKEIRYSDVIVDLPTALHRLGGDQELLNDLATFYLEDYPSLRSRLQEASRDADFSLAAHTAHSLRGIASTFDSFRVAKACNRLEEAARNQDIETLKELTRVVSEEVELVAQSLERELGVSSRPHPASN